MSLITKIKEKNIKSSLNTYAKEYGDLIYPELTGLVLTSELNKKNLPLALVSFQTE